MTLYPIARLDWVPRLTSTSVAGKRFCVVPEQVEEPATLVAPIWAPGVDVLAKDAGACSTEDLALDTRNPASGWCRQYVLRVPILDVKRTPHVGAALIY